MPVTSAGIGMRSTFWVGDGFDGGSTDYAKIGEVASITSPEITRETEDATHLESPDDFREYIAALLDTGSATIGFNYIPSAGDPLYTAMLAGKGDFRIIYPNGVKMDFSGIPTSWNPGDPSPEKMTGEFTVKPSGKPVFS